LQSAKQAFLLRKRARWEQLESGLQKLSPKAILGRGYALVFDSENRLIRESTQLSPGNKVRAQLARGEFTAVVEKTVDSA